MKKNTTTTDTFTQAVTDWRFHVLLVLTMAGVVLTASDADGALSFIAGKAAGIAALAATAWLGARWRWQGHITWIDALADDDEEEG